MRPAIALSCLLAAGCLHLPLKSDAADPVRVEGFKASFPSPDHGDVTLDLVVHNPHAGKGHLSEVSWELWLNGRWFAAGVAQISEELPGRGTRRLHVSLPVSFRRTSRIATDAPLDIGIRGQVRAEFGGLGGGPEGLVFLSTLRQPLPGAPLRAPDEDEG